MVASGFQGLPEEHCPTWPHPCRPEGSCPPGPLHSRHSCGLLFCLLPLMLSSAHSESGAALASARGRPRTDQCWPPWALCLGRWVGISLA